jgi:hypothetical protein
VRHFTTHWSDAGVPKVLEYRENVIADGQGKFSVDPLALIEPPSSQSESDLFLLLQKLRESLMYRYRDFAVRDIDGFLANYSLVDTGVRVTVAGVLGERLQIEKRDNPDRRYIVDVDLATGLILRSREELLDGTLVTLSEFESLTYAPDLSGAVMHTPINDETPLPPDTIASTAALGFKPRTPKQIPEGWKLIGFSKLTDPITGRVWAKFAYSDGVEPIFFVVAKGDGPYHQVTPPPAGGSPPPQPDRVRRLAVGSWTLIEAQLSKGDALVLGRAADQVLLDLVQSAFF